MGRVEDNEALHKTIKANMPDAGTLEELNSNYLATIASYMCDISKSLALIADSSEAGKLAIKLERLED